MKDYELKLETLLQRQNNICTSCGEVLDRSKKIDLAHSIKASKKNYELFNDVVIDHLFNLTATHPGKCNDKCNRSRAAYPVEAQERIIDILGSILLNDPLAFEYPKLMRAFDNMGHLLTDNPVYIAQYEILENFFEHYRDL